MATYSEGLYGLPLYGQQPDTGFYDAKLVAWSYDYNTTYIKWSRAVKNPTDPDIKYWKLIKSVSGTPDDPADAIIVASGPYSDYVTSYTDTTDYDESTEVNYSLWVFNEQEWILCGSAVTIVIVNDGSLTKVLKWVPRVWSNSIDGVGDAAGEPTDKSEYGSHDFANVMSAFVFEYDRFRAETAVLANISSVSLASSKLLKYKVLELGFNYEPTLGDNYHRSLYNSGNLINADKGTTKALSTYVTALTHWGNDVTIGHNIMLDYNDSSFEETVGNWSGGLVNHQYANYPELGYVGFPVVPPVPHLSDSEYPPRQLGFASLSTAATTPVTLTLPSGGRIPDTAIPVTGNTAYIFTGWVQQLDSTAATISANIIWYDAFGNTIGKTANTSLTTSSASWKEFLSESTSGRGGVLSPVKAVYAGLSVKVTPAAATASRYIFDMFMLSDPASSYEYQDARRINIAVSGEYENYVINPSFEEGVGGWIASPNGSFAQDPTVSPSSLVWPTHPAPYDPGELPGHVGELTIFSYDGTSYHNAWITSDWLPVDPGQNYTFSGYASSDDTITNVVARIEFSNKVSVDQQDHIFTDADGNYFDSSVYYADSDPVLIEGTPYTDPLTGEPTLLPIKSRFSVTAIVPQATKDSGQPLAKLSIYLPSLPDNPVPGMNRTVWFDGLLFQDSIGANPYFDGSGAPIPADPINEPFYSSNDTSWEIKNRINFIDNSSFESGTTGWSSSSTLSTVSDPSNFPYNFAGERIINDDGTYGDIVRDPVTGNPALFYFPPKYGTQNLVVQYAPNFIVAGAPVTHYGVTELENPGAEGVTSYIETTVYLPAPALGGEDVTVSMFVRGSEGVYTLSGYNGTYSTTNDIFSKSISVVQHDQYQWIRIQTTRQLLPGETSFKARLVHVSSAPYVMPGKIPQSGFFLVDGVQAEYGRIATAFVDPNVDAISMPNPLHPAGNIYLTRAQSAQGGKSSYLHHWSIKSTRLKETLPLVLPYNSTWAIQRGVPLPEFSGELTSSLIPSASFERDLGKWQGIHSTLTRKYAKGTLFQESLVHGAAYCAVATSRTSGDSSYTFGITTGLIPVLSNHGYYSSVAVKPINGVASGTYTLRVDFYGPNAADVLAATGSLPTPIPALQRYTANSAFISANTASLYIGLNNLAIGAEITVVGLPTPYNGVGLNILSNADGVITYTVATTPDRATETVSGTVTSDATDGTRSTSAVISRTDRWAYLGVVNPASTTIGAAYAVLSVTCNPGISYNAAQSFAIDKAVFRE